MELLPEFLLSSYDSVDFIDRGAFGRVYKCNRAGITTAVKILDALDSESQARFQAEVEILQSLNHANVVKILDANITDGNYWYESEYATQGHFGKMAGYLFYSDVDRVEYFSQICEGIKVLHELSPPLIHRDIKPSNILVFENSGDQRVTLKIADFGLAAIAGTQPRLTKTGVLLGTAHYIAPERERNPSILTPRSDIYSLGVTFLEACTGRTRLTPENLDLVPAILRPIVEKMVRENPLDRYQSVSDVLMALNTFSVWQLYYGKELEEGEIPGPFFNVNIGREIENELNSLLKSDSENILARLSEFEKKLDRLGEAYDHQAHAIALINPNLAGVIEAASYDALLQLVQRFLSAAEKTKDDDWYAPDQDNWGFFLGNTYRISSYRPTKSLCLEGLVQLLDRFDSMQMKHHLFHTLIRIDDPSYMEDITERLRQIGRKDIASLLTGVPEFSDLDTKALIEVLF